MNIFLIVICIFFGVLTVAIAILSWKLDNRPLTPEEMEEQIRYIKEWNQKKNKKK